MKRIKNNQKSIEKSLPAHGFNNSLEKNREPEVSQIFDFCQIFVISINKTIP